MTIADVLNIFIDKRLSKYNIYSVLGTVVSVDSTARTCSVQEEDGALYTDVKLQGLNNSINGFLLTPKIGSWVMITFFQRNLAYVTCYTDLDSITSKVPQITFNDGNNGGLTNTPELKKQLDYLTKRVDGIISMLSNPTVVAGIVAALGDTGVSYTTAIQTISRTLIPKENFDNIEDLTIKH